MAIPALLFLQSPHPVPEQGLKTPLRRGSALISRLRASFRVALLPLPHIAVRDKETGQFRWSGR